MCKTAFISMVTPFQGVGGCEIRVLGQSPKAVSTRHRSFNAVPFITVFSALHLFTSFLPSAWRIRPLTFYKHKKNFLSVVKGVRFALLIPVLQVLASTKRACLTYLTEYSTSDTPILSPCGLPLSVNLVYPLIAYENY